MHDCGGCSPREERSDMRFLRIGDRGHERPVMLDRNGTAWDLTSVADDIDGRFFATDGPARAAAALEGGTLPVIDLTGLRRGAPIARPPSIICVGMNYAAHAAESGAAPPTEV